MRFMDQIPASMHSSLLEAGRLQPVADGVTLIRRGDRGGALYLIESGKFQVVDTRSHPELVLDIVGPGDVLGEVTFVDDAPRGADVRAAEPSTVMVWERATILDLFVRDPALAAEFYRAVARTLSIRYRTFSAAVASGSVSGRAGAPHSGDCATQAHAYASKILQLWGDADERLRRDPSDARARTLLKTGMEYLCTIVARWLQTLHDGETRSAAARILRQALRPYMRTANVGRQALQASDSATGEASLMETVLAHTPAGDGPFGLLLDQHLHALPTLAALRARNADTIDLARRVLPQGAPLRVTLINVHSTHLPAAILESLGQSNSSIRFLDGRPEVLAHLRQQLLPSSRSVETSFVEEDIAAIAMQRSTVALEPQDVILLDGLIDYLPDGLAMSLLQWCRDQLKPGGLLICNSLAALPDARILDHILAWPLVRRTPQDLTRLIESVDRLSATLQTNDRAGAVVLASLAPPTC